MLNPTRLLPLVLALGGVAWAPAAAQSAIGSPAQQSAPVERPSISIAAGVMPWMDPDLGVGPGQWSATATARVSAHWFVEPEVAGWRYTARWPRANGAPVLSTDQRTWWTAGANMVYRARVGRVALYGGVGGAIAWTHNRRTWTAGPTLESTHSTLAMTFLVGTDIWLTPRMAATVALRARVVPEADLGVAGPCIGVRFGL